MLKNVASHFLKLCIIVSVILGIIIGLFLVPNIANFAGKLYPNVFFMKYGIYTVLYGIILSYFYIFYKAFCILRRLDNGQIFTIQSMKILKKIQITLGIAICIFILGLPLFIVMTMEMDPPLWFFTSPIILPLLILFAITHIFEQLLKEVLEHKK